MEENQVTIKRILHLMKGQWAESRDLKTKEIFFSIFGVE
jgi:hypothetical protein